MSPDQEARLSVKALCLALPAIQGNQKSRAGYLTLLILLLNRNFFKSTGGLLSNNIALGGQNKPRKKAQQNKPYALESGVVSPS